ncbi:MAG: hypothetical protein ACLUKH_22510, partial [Flavonifractor plautii]
SFCPVHPSITVKAERPFPVKKSFYTISQKSAVCLILEQQDDAICTVLAVGRNKGSRTAVADTP